jgi:hypothetical protein
MYWAMGVTVAGKAAIIDATPRAGNLAVEQRMRWGVD